MDSQSILLEQLTRVANSFVKTLEEIPEEKFHLAPALGGHSAAWHALHIADWVQILVPNKLESVAAELRLGYLGWKEAEFAHVPYHYGQVKLILKQL
jgi:DinB superfamily